MYVGSNMYLFTAVIKSAKYDQDSLYAWGAELMHKPGNPKVIAMLHSIVD